MACGLAMEPRCSNGVETCFVPQLLRVNDSLISPRAFLVGKIFTNWQLFLISSQQAFNAASRAATSLSMSDFVKFFLRMIMRE